MTAKTRAREEKVESVDGTHLVVFVKALPVEGRANDAIASLVARHLGVPRSQVLLRSGATGKHKVFDVR